MLGQYRLLPYIPGVVKHIGDMLKNHFPKSRNNLVAIGIAPWGVITERDSLIGCGVNDNQKLENSSTKLKK